MFGLVVGAVCSWRLSVCSAVVSAMEEGSIRRLSAKLHRFQSSTRNCRNDMQNSQTFLSISQNCHNIRFQINWSGFEIYRSQSVDLQFGSITFFAFFCKYTPRLFALSDRQKVFQSSQVCNNSILENILLLAKFQRETSIFQCRSSLSVPYKLDQLYSLSRPENIRLAIYFLHFQRVKKFNNSKMCNNSNDNNSRCDIYSYLMFCCFSWRPNNGHHRIT